jgi:hypothetical protein
MSTLSHLPREVDKMPFLCHIVEGERIIIALLPVSQSMGLFFAKS